MQSGISFDDMEYMSEGQATDFCIEHANDSYYSAEAQKKKEIKVATQADFDAFKVAF